MARNSSVMHRLYWRSLVWCCQIVALFALPLFGCSRGGGQSSDLEFGFVVSRYGGDGKLGQAFLKGVAAAKKQTRSECFETVTNGVRQDKFAVRDGYSSPGRAANAVADLIGYNRAKLIIGDVDAVVATEAAKVAASVSVPMVVPAAFGEQAGEPGKFIVYMRPTPEAEARAMKKWRDQQQVKSIVMVIRAPGTAAMNQRRVQGFVDAYGKNETPPIDWTLLRNGNGLSQDVWDRIRLAEIIHVYAPGVKTEQLKIVVETLYKGPENGGGAIVKEIQFLGHETDEQTFEQIAMDDAFWKDKLKSPFHIFWPIEQAQYEDAKKELKSATAQELLLVAFGKQVVNCVCLADAKEDLAASLAHKCPVRKGGIRRFDVKTREHKWTGESLDFESYAKDHVPRAGAVEGTGVQQGATR